jgi:DNA-binding protein HU-beta
MDKPAAASKSSAAPKTKTESISTKQIATELAKKHELSNKAAGQIIDDFVALTTRHLKKGARIRINGLGILSVRKRAARMGRNPATGEQIKIKASKKVSFRPSKELKEAI